MERYTLYFCDVGRMPEIAEISCDDDAAAVRVARQLFDGRAMVLWHGDRNVASWARQDRAVQGLEARA